MINDNYKEKKKKKEEEEEANDTFVVVLCELHKSVLHVIKEHSLDLFL